MCFDDRPGRCAGVQASYSIDENLYHTSYESGMLEDPATPPPPEMFKMTTCPTKVSNDGLELSWSNSRCHVDDGRKAVVVVIQREGMTGLFS